MLRTGTCSPALYQQLPCCAAFPVGEQSISEQAIPALCSSDGHSSLFSLMNMNHQGPDLKTKP